MMIGFGERRRNVREVAELFNETHSELDPIGFSTVSKFHRKYLEKTFVRDKPKSGRPSTALDTQVDTLLTVPEHPHSSTRQLRREFKVARNRFEKLLHKPRYYSYKMNLVQELSEDNLDRSLEYWERLMQILFSGEATFILNGTVNRQNCRYLPTDNPHWMQETHTQYPQKLNVLAGIMGDRIMGPFFLDGRLTEFFEE